MYREADFQACMAGLVGWRQNTNPDYATLPSSLTNSSSGLYFQDEHPLISIQNIDQCDFNYDQFNYPAWSAVTIYGIATGPTNWVRFTDGKVYSSLQAANQNHSPDSSPTWWELVDQTAQKIAQITSAAASKLLTRVFTEKKLNDVTKSIFENIQLFDGAGSLLNKEIPQGRFCGFEIFLKDNRDLITVIKKLGTQFTTANPGFTLYIFHSSQSQPLFKIPVALTKAISFEWNTILSGGNPILMKYLSYDYGIGGSFYIGYYEDDLAVGSMAINKGYDFGSIPYCRTCNNDYRYWSSWSEYLRIQPFVIGAADIAGKRPQDTGGNPTLWDIHQTQYQYTKNFGLNLDFTVKCDVTDFLCREIYLFSDCLLKQIAMDVLNLIAFSFRNNAAAKQTRDLAMYALNNKDNNTPGVSSKFEKAIKALSFDISDLNDACLPCDKKYGSNWTTL
jgi:hypothetical protein